jgi:hypothetical protein
MVQTPNPLLGRKLSVKKSLLIGCTEKIPGKKVSNSLNNPSQRKHCFSKSANAQVC